ncbi:MAG: hypothetical protein KAU50_12155 [Candidatus Marinimicrobia bacterium]|nr:hypothetical protein [Candidatus Neomarinimicrobiota bacterium]
MRFQWFYFPYALTRFRQMLQKSPRGPGAGCDGPIAKIARDFRIRLNEGLAVTLVDFKAGFKDSAWGVITSLDWAIVIVDPTSPAVELAAHMNRMVDQIKAGQLPFPG